MRLFDRIDAADLDRRELQLWLLATVTILILAAGMALLMYPAVFSAPVVLAGATLRKMFFGFCALSMLLAGYLLDRYLAMRHLRKQLTEEKIRNIALHEQAGADLLGTLPEYGHFQDRLPMEMRRAATTQQPLSLVIVHLKPSESLTEGGAISAAFGDAAKTMIRRLRREDSIYRFAPQVFGILLPGAGADAAYRVVDRLAEGLHDASGASDQFTFELRVVNYPEHTTTASGMEQGVRAFFSEARLVPPGVEVRAATMEAA